MFISLTLHVASCDLYGTFCILIDVCVFLLNTLYAQGDLVDAVVPFMGESISDGTLATFLKSMLPCIVFLFALT